MHGFRDIAGQLIYDLSWGTTLCVLAYLFRKHPELKEFILVKPEVNVVTDIGNSGAELGGYRASVQ